jgi:hypothetical protein
MNQDSASGDVGVAKVARNFFVSVQGVQQGSGAVEERDEE